MTDFAATKAMFHIPDGMIYLDGNSLGPLPKAAPARVAKAMTEEWGEMLITGWNKAGWMAKATEVGDRVAKLIGAEAGHVANAEPQGAQTEFGAFKASRPICQCDGNGCRLQQHVLHRGRQSGSFRGARTGRDCDKGRDSAGLEEGGAGDSS